MILEVQARGGLRTGDGGVGGQGTGSYSRVWAAVILSNIWRPQFLNKDSDDADKQDEVHLVGGDPHGWSLREGRC